MTNRRDFLIGGAAAITAPLVAPAVLAALPLEKITVAARSRVMRAEYTLDHATTDAFCGVQEVENMTQPWYYVTTTRYWDDHPFKSMQFLIQKTNIFEEIDANMKRASALDLRSLNESSMFWGPDINPVKLFRGLRQVDIKDNGFDLMRCANWIAKSSRRGRGNIVLYNPALSVPPDPAEKFMKLIAFNQLEKNEYVIMYKGASKYDAAIFKIKTPMWHDNRFLIYAAHDHLSSYAIRFRLGNKKFDPDDLPPVKDLKFVYRSDMPAPPSLPILMTDVPYEEVVGKY